VFREALNQGKWESLLTGVMNPGAALGNHYHKKTVVFLYLTRGAAVINTVHVETGKTDSFELRAPAGVILNTFESHVIKFVEESEFIMLKSSAYDPSDPDTYHYPVTV
jgi:hypothetical protein